jgi:hypothetical protein
MANHVSSLKRARQTVVKTEVNRANRTRVRGSLRLMREALAKGDARRPDPVPRDRLRARQERPEGRSAQEHRFALQEPPERPPQDAGPRRSLAAAPSRPQEKGLSSSIPEFNLK